MDQSTLQVSYCTVGVSREEAAWLAKDAFAREMLDGPTRWAAKLKDGWEVTV